MKMTKLAALILAAIMLVLTAVGCSNESVAALTFRDTVISENEYCYMMSYYKAIYLYAYFGKTADDATVWASELADGVSVGDYLGALTVSNIMSSAVYVQLFEDYGLSLTNEEINTIDESINNAIKAEGSKSALNSALSAFGANVDTLRKVKTDSLKVTKVQEYLFGENGTLAPTAEELDEYYKENYYRTKFIFTSKNVEYERDENGEYIKDAEGNYSTYELYADEKAAKKALAADIEAKVNSGEDFDTLLAEYTMDTGMRHFEDGYYINSASTFVEDAVKTAVAGLEIGEVTSLETDAGWYMIKRLELIDKAYEKEEYAAAMFNGGISEVVKTVKTQALLAEFSDEIVINEDIVANYPLAYCTPNFKY